MNCYRIHLKSLNFIYPFKFYSNFTNKNVSWLHFSWATQYSATLPSAGAVGSAARGAHRERRRAGHIVAAARLQLVKLRSVERLSLIFSRAIILHVF